MIKYGVILFIAILVWDLVSDYTKWLKDRKVRHSKEGWIRAALLIPAGLLLTPGLFVDNREYQNLPLAILATAGLMFAWWWLLFDGLYNKLRGFGWWFTGSDDPDDPILDNLLQWLGPAGPWMKISLMIGTTLFYCYLIF